MPWAFIFLGARIRQGLRHAAIFLGLVIVAIAGVVAILWGGP